MSRLHADYDLIEGADGAPANDYDPKKFTLQRRRKKPLHPDAIEDRLRRKAASTLPDRGWSWPYGWLLISWDLQGVKYYHQLPPSMAYREAEEIRNDAMATGLYEKAWLIQKSARKEK